MAGNDLFEAMSEAMEANSSLSSLEARGTLRIALKVAGLEPKKVLPEQMRVVLERVLPGELESQGLDRIEPLIDTLYLVVDTVEVTGDGAHADAPEDVFRRTRESAS